VLVDALVEINKWYELVGQWKQLCRGRVMPRRVLGTHEGQRLAMCRGIFCSSDSYGRWLGLMETVSHITNIM
jgi:hypothetical protein